MTVPVLQCIAALCLRCIVPGTCIPLSLGCALIAAHAETPQRIVSLNICTDELLLRLVEPSRVASVTWLSRDPSLSNIAALAAAVPVNHGSAEEVIPSAPDLVDRARQTG